VPPPPFNIDAPLLGKHPFSLNVSMSPHDRPPLALPNLYAQRPNTRLAPLISNPPSWHRGMGDPRFSPHFFSRPQPISPLLLLFSSSFFERPRVSPNRSFLCLSVFKSPFFCWTLPFLWCPNRGVFLPLIRVFFLSLVLPLAFSTFTSTACGLAGWTAGPGTIYGVHRPPVEYFPYLGSIIVSHLFLATLLFFLIRPSSPP